jgi:hypothetical protein
LTANSRIFRERAFLGGVIFVISALFAVVRQSFCRFCLDDSDRLRTGQLRGLQHKLLGLGRLRHPVLVAVHRHPLDFGLVRLDFGNIVVAQLCGGVVQVGHFVESVPLGLSEPEPVHSGGNALLLGRHQSRRRACSRRYVGGERFGVAVPVPVPVYDVSVGKTPSCIRIGRYRRCSRRTTLEAERRRDAFRVERLLSGQVLVVVARTLDLSVLLHLRGFAVCSGCRSCESTCGLTRHALPHESSADFLL